MTEEERKQVEMLKTLSSLYQEAYMKDLVSISSEGEIYVTEKFFTAISKELEITTLHYPDGDSQKKVVINNYVFATYIHGRNNEKR